jgi:hypothetical protein
MVPETSLNARSKVDAVRLSKKGDSLA